MIKATVAYCPQCRCLWGSYSKFKWVCNWDTLGHWFRTHLQQVAHLWHRVYIYILGHLADFYPKNSNTDAHQERFRVQCLAQGHFNMQLRGARIQTGDLLITRRPPELQPPWQITPDGEKISLLRCSTTYTWCPCSSNTLTPPLTSTTLHHIAVSFPVNHRLQDLS